MYPGSSSIIMPTDVADFLNARIGAVKTATGNYQLDCTKVSSLAAISFYLGGKAYPLEGTDYILESQGTCISSFVGLDDSGSGSQWVVGENLTNAVVRCSLNHKF